MLNKSLIQGSLSMLILRLLDEKDMYGYEMIETLRKRSENVFELKAGSLYPLLHALEANNLVTAYEDDASVMEQGDFSQAMGTALLKRRDDFGKLAASLESMRNEMSGLIGEVKSQATEITRMVQEIDDNIQALDEEIENVSATTEELAAGMEETAASSEEINAMSHEIESAAKSIATRSQDGATEADDIRDRAVGIKKTTTENDERTKAIHAEINEGLTKALEDIKVVDQIGVLAESIMEITGQTNLLALNASIEAAQNH